MQLPGRIDTVDLFPKLDDELHALLETLSADDWQKQSIAPRWNVKDIAAHLLDGNIRAISMFRDRYFRGMSRHIESYRDLVNYLNDINAGWVEAMKAVSPEVITSLLRITGIDYCKIMRSLPPGEKSVFSVAWAGEEESLNWFHIAREYTEKWHHQQQIRLAVGQTGILYSKKFYLPYLDTSMRALPFHYRNINAAPGTLIRFNVSGEGGGDWFLYREEYTWVLTGENDQTPDCIVYIDGQMAWRIFTGGISAVEAMGAISISGNKDWGEHFLSMRAVMI